MSDTPRTEDAAQTPVEDLCRNALEHYDEVSTKACSWTSSIPRAIKFYFLEKPKLERELAAAEERAKVAEAAMAAERKARERADRRDPYYCGGRQEKRDE